MATQSDAHAVKTLNQGPGRRRFVFKTLSQKIEEIEIDVFRSLDPLKAEPSKGSSFFLECLVQWRELNTAEDFISFYEEIMPSVQTLPQVILHKELILSKLLSRLQLKGRLSVEPILRLIAALSRDLLEDFIPFLQRIANSVVSLLKSGADREPEIVEQIFTSWSQIMMYLQKYLVRDLVFVLKATVRLRYYHKHYVQEFMAEAVSFLLRNSPVEQLIKGIRKVMFEVVKKPTMMRKSGVSVLLWYVMRGTSTRLHSRAEQVLRLLMDNSIFSIGDKFSRGSDTILEVVIAAFKSLCEELEPTELNKMWDCLYEEITQCVTNSYTLHLSHLLSLLISTVQVDYIRKISDFQPMLQLVDLLVRTLIMPATMVDAEDQPSEVVDKVLQLILCVLDGLCIANNMSVLSSISLQWAPVFELKNSSLPTFIKQLLLKDPFILRSFRINMISALSGLIEKSEKSEEEVVYLVLIFCERLQIKLQSSGSLDGTSNEEVSRICSFLHDSIDNCMGWINRIVHQDQSSVQLQETELAMLWGVISCYPYVVDVQANPYLLLNLVDALDQLLMTESENIAGFRKHTWQSLIGAALSSFRKLNFANKTGHEEVGKFLDLARRYKSSSQILTAVADFLDSLDWSQADTGHKVFHPELKSERTAESLNIFAENLCHSDKGIRLSTLRILCHYEPLNSEYFAKDQPLEKKMGTEVSETSLADNQGSNVFQLLLSIEVTPLSVTTSREFIILISRIQTDLSAARVSEICLPSVLYGIIGILHNRFSPLWNPALECLTVLVNKYSGLVWHRYVQYLEQCQSMFLTSHNQSDRSNTESSNCSSDLVELFNSFVTPAPDRTPCMTVLSLLIQSLQKVPTITESRSRQIIPLFLKFLGYNSDDILSVISYNSQACKGKEWKSVLTEWLNLLILMRNPVSFYQSRFLKEVLQYRLLDDTDAEVQMKVLDCLFNWKDDFLLPYELHLKNLIISKNIREELTTWSLSKESNHIEAGHRTNLVPLIIRILIPKVRNLKTLSSRKHASVPQRKAVIRFLVQLDVDELPLFFALLIKPLLSVPGAADGITNWLWSSPESSKDGFESFSVLKFFTTDNISALSLKKRYGFLHVIEDIFGVFDEPHIIPFLDLLIGCVVRVLQSCTSSLVCVKNIGSSLGENEKEGEAANEILTGTPLKQFKDLRSLCLKIISSVLNKYDNHDFGCEFWELFFTSVKPLVDGFKQEGASSEKPSSLFSCFLAMSKSYQLVSLLDREKNLVRDIFSILTVTTASEAIVSCVLKFIENLLELDSELDSQNNIVRGIVLCNLDTLVRSLHCLFKGDNGNKRKLVKCSGGGLVSIFKLLSKYISDPSAAMKFVDILLPLLEKRAQNSEAQVEILQVIRNIVPLLGNENTAKIVNAVSPLLVSAGLNVRGSICDLLDTLGENDTSLHSVAKIVRELNATSVTEIGELDYDTIVSAYGKITKDFFHTAQEKQALLILSHSVHDMSSDELILRHSAYRLLVLFVEFSAGILDGEMNSDEGHWSRACIQCMINNFFLKHIGDAVNKEASVQKVWIDLLREMVLKLPKVSNLDSLRALCSDDPEQDFFNNIMHLQKHRRAKALSRFKNFAHAVNLSAVIINKVFVPLFFSMLFDVQDGKGEHVRGACSEALASISAQMEWKSYYVLLVRCFQEITLKPNKQKVLLRLICSILDHFHFFEIHSSREVKESAGDVSKPGMIDTSSSTSLHECTSSAHISEIQTSLQKIFLPKIRKLLTSDSDNVNVNISLVALKLLKLLPGDIMDSQLPSIVHRISNFLKGRLESTREEARFALAACLKELGLEYLQFIVKVLRSTLKRGYELHVLGYSLNFILSKCLSKPISGKLDYCLDDLLSVVESDIMGDVSEEKEVEKIASKMKETRKRMSFETLKLIAQNVTFCTHALKILSPVTAHLQKHLTPKVKSKLEAMLSHIAAGIECNPSVSQNDLFIFTHGLIKDGITDENPEPENFSQTGADKNCRNEARNKLVTSGRVTGRDSQCSHLIMVFALGVLHNRVKNMKIHKKDEQLLSMLDPFVKLLGDCLSSKYEDVISSALKCFAPLVRLPLPSLESQADKIKTSLLVLAHGSANANSPLMQSCLTLLTTLLGNTRITLSTDQLHMLIQFPVFVDLERNPSFVALSLLKAIVKRKLVVHEIYDLVTRVAELMVTSQVEPIRRKCSQIFLQFLLDYRLSKKRLQEHLDFLLANLRYEHSTGREAVLEMLRAIIMKFPISVVDEQSQTVFVNLVVCLANDHDNKVRSMTGAAIKLLIGRVSPSSLNTILEYSLSWYMGGKQHLWSAAAQVLGLLVEVMKNGFQRHIHAVFPVMRSILQSALNVLTNGQLNLSNEATVPFWKEAYYSLVMFEKILHQFHEMCLEKDLEGIWEAICEFLLHPHMWLRNISNRLVAVYFATVTEAHKQNHEKPLGTFLLMRPSRLFLTAVYFCCQLKAQLDDMTSNLLTKNIVFVICAVDSMMVKNKCVDPKRFWSTLEHHEQGLFLKAFQLLDSRKGRSMFASLTSDVNDQNDVVNIENRQYFLVSCLLKRMGKIALQGEASQMKIVFDSFRSVSSRIIDRKGDSSQACDNESKHYAYQMLLPLYKVSEGFAGKVIPDDVKQLAQDVSGSIKKTMGQNFVEVYNEIRKNLKAKRDKRKQEQKVMAVVNPVRHAKRKLRIAAKHQANKKRKMMTMKMGRWMQ